MVRRRFEAFGQPYLLVKSLRSDSSSGQKPLVRLIFWSKAFGQTHLLGKSLWSASSSAQKPLVSLIFWSKAFGQPHLLVKTDQNMRLTKCLETSSITAPFTAEKPRNVHNYMDRGESLKSRSRHHYCSR